MSLRHAILGFLSVGPQTGYDLKKRFDESVRHFWTADKAAIYRMLTEIEAAGLATSERVAQATRPDRHVFRISADGLAELDRWLTTPLVPEVRREPFLLQLFFADRLTQEQRAALFTAELANVEEEIGALRAVAAALRDHPPPVGPVLTLAAGLASLQAWRAWVVQARDRWERGDPDLSGALLAEMAAPASRSTT